MNGKPDLRLGENDVVIHEAPQPIQFWNAVPKLFSGPLLSMTLVTCFLMFAKDLAMFGTQVFWPQVWAHVDGLPYLSPARELMLTSALGVPGVLLAILFIGALPRKKAVVCGATVCGVSVLFLRGLSSGKWTAFTGVVGYKFLSPTFQMIALLLPSELFGSQVRGLAFGIAATCGRTGPLIAPFLVELGIDGFTAILASVLLGAAIVVNFLPETKDIELSEDIDSSQLSPRRLFVGASGEGSYGALGPAKV